MTSFKLHSLSEIYSALTTPQGEISSLYPISDSTAYSLGTFFGRVIKFFYDAWYRVRCVESPYSVERTMTNILTTLFDRAVHRVYDLRQNRIRHWLNDPLQGNENADSGEVQQRYEQFLKKELSGSIAEEETIQRHVTDFVQKNATRLFNAKKYRHTLLEFHEATRIFWSTFLNKSKREQHFHSIIERFLQHHSTLKDAALFRALTKELHWVKLEGMTCQSIPVALLAKLEDPSQLKVEEKRCLKSWINQLNQCKEKISPHQLYTVLKEVIDLIHMQKSSTLRLQDLLVWLEREKCEILTQQDLFHMRWRQKLKSGDSITCDKKQYLLGRELGPQKILKNTFRVFELENSPHCIKFAQNLFQLHIEARKEVDQVGFRLVKTIELDPEGRCLIMEKLSEPLKDYQWTSKSVHLNPEDQLRALVLANHLYCMQERRFSVDDLPVDALMWDQEGNLRSTKLLKETTFDYISMENHCVRLAKGNDYVLHFLMNVSKLSEHEVAHHCRQIIEETITTGQNLLIANFLPREYRKDSYEPYFYQLCENLLLQRKEGIEAISTMDISEKFSHKKVEKWVVERMIEIYRASPTPGRVGELQKEVVESYSKRDFPKQSELNATPYYQQQFQLMMKYNKASQEEVTKA